MSTQKRHSLLMDALGDVAAPAPAMNAPTGKASPDVSVPALNTAGELLREELATERSRANALEQKLQELLESPAEQKIAPHLIRHGRFRDRHELGFKDAKFQELKASIQEEGGNVAAVLLRPLAEPDQEGREYEVVWGHRRHMACLDLGLDVNAVVRSLDDREAVTLMTLENKLREGLSQYELAKTYKIWLDEGVFPNQQAIAEKEKLAQPTISRIMAINDLPAEIVGRIEDPRKITGNWTVSILGLLAADREAVMGRLQALEGKLSPKGLLAALADRQAQGPKELSVGGKRVLQATPVRGKDGKVTWPAVKVYVDLDEAKLEKLAAFLAKL